MGEELPLLGRGGRGGRAGREGWSGGAGSCTNRRDYSANEIAQLLEIVEDVLPISGAEWEVVETRHYAYYSDMEGTADQLHKKFNNLARTTIPT